MTYNLFRVSRRPVQALLVKTLYRTGLNADSTVNTGKRIDLPELFLFIDRNTLRWASHLAYAAKDTFFHFYFQFAFCILEWFNLLKRIKPCRVLGQQILQNGLCHEHGFFSLGYLSVQLMHGSIVRIRIGTSARSQPGSISSRGGILAKVGVLMRSLSRNFFPLALI